MAKARPARKLKVYAAQIGFFDTIVAAPNQAAALAAWGVRQNLFAEGRARVSKDEANADAALANPGVPLRRAIGSLDAFSLEPALPRAPAAPGPPRLKVVAEAKGPVKPRPDRSALARAERALAAVNQRRAEEEADIRRRREALDAEDEASRGRWRQDRAKAEKGVVEARRAYEASGGEA